MMNIQQLTEKLENIGVPKELYNFDDSGREDERFCIRKEKELWNVYYKERGEKTTNEYFKTEDEACNYVLRQLL